eukprot:scaffold65690_cov29-Tisochrysis_lutea.AAC.6
MRDQLVEAVLVPPAARVVAASRSFESQHVWSACLHRMYWRCDPGGSATRRPGHSMMGAGRTRIATVEETDGVTEAERLSSEAVACQHARG